MLKLSFVINVKPAEQYLNFINTAIYFRNRNILNIYALKYMA